MHSRIVATFPFSFPFEKQSSPSVSMLPISSLQRGPQGRFGLALEPVVDFSTKKTMCSFFEIDLRTERINRSDLPLPYSYLARVLLCYDQMAQGWIVALQGVAHGAPFEVYEVARPSATSWPRLFADNELNTEYQIERMPITFWQQGPYTPLLLEELDASYLYARNVYWTQWRSPLGKRPPYEYLQTSYSVCPYVCEAGFLLFSCQAIYDHLSTTAPNMNLAAEGPGHWQFLTAAYGYDGRLRGHTVVPQVSFPLRNQHIARYDFNEWLLPFLYAAQGPTFDPFGQASCIAALVMKDEPQRLSTLFNKPIRKPREPDPAQGGLYWVDLHGRILAYDPTMLGEQVSTCICGNVVIGTSLHEEERQLWRWSPASGQPRQLLGMLGTQVTRATVVAPEETGGESASWFWCVEEEQEGIRVTQRNWKSGQEVQTSHWEGIKLPDRITGYHTWEWRPLGIAAYQDTLLVLGFDQERRLHLLQFISDLP